MRGWGVGGCWVAGLLGCWVVVWAIVVVTGASEAVVVTVSVGMTIVGLPGAGDCSVVAVGDVVAAGAGARAGTVVAFGYQPGSFSWRVGPRKAFATTATAIEATMMRTA